MGRYVILRHERPDGGQPGVHWDLMLEAGPALRTWALAEEPTLGLAVAAEELPEHRLLYLDYEGPISGDRGTVRRWDTGRFEMLSESPLEIVIRFAGDRLRCEATLTRVDEDSKTWEFRLGVIC